MKRAGKSPDSGPYTSAESPFGCGAGTGEGIASEFLPPVDALQAEKTGLGIPWERELDAVAAWQAAGGNVDSEWDACVWETRCTRLRGTSNASRAAGPDAANEPPTMATVVRLTTSLVSLRERLFRMQSEVTDVARGEMRERRTPADDADAAPARSVVRRPLGAPNSARILRLARDYVAALDLARAGMASLVGLQPMNEEAAAEPMVDRRRNRVLIDFPDRRSAG
ncbi:hypothetical protein [Methyloversatilis sp. XJ19-49]|uniref:hypothetical protein n=1 Tax=Methyloversatilis sp. XJ19-49 TaxID=2963429 RepID=UPI00211BC25B|nr:hypothetical protein [Methyloversatilis sp. XJ19-49]MCQ9378030.1 hypothetical protein [Methyloversatilis sp. XJ19-49]